MYEQINYVLASYFNISVAGSKAEADESLRRSIAASEDFSRLLRAELRSALVDEEFSWICAFEENEVDFFASEEDARTYAKQRLWDPFFGEWMERRDAW